MKKIFTALTISIALISCTNEEETSENQTEDPETYSESFERIGKAKSVFYSIPSPLETSSILQKAGVTYNPKIMHDITKVNNYSTSYKQAINFGVYAADLSYAGIYEQSQDALFYLECLYKVADNLGLSTVFDASIYERLERNSNNRDSLMQIISEVYLETDGFLKENHRENIAALILAGGWIEGLYLGSYPLEGNYDEAVAKTIAEQKLSYENLNSLLNTFPNDNAITDIKIVLSDLDQHFNAIKVENEETSVSNEESEGVTTIGGGSNVEFTKESILELRAAVIKIRADFIK